MGTHELALTKPLSVTGETLREQLDCVDEQIVNSIYGGFYLSRLGIIVGQWEKGRIISLYRAGYKGKFTFRELEVQSGRKQENLKSWNDLYEKHPNRSEFIETCAKPRAELWTRRVIEKGKNLLGSEIKGHPEPLPEGQYRVIYADPPWPYDFSISDSRRIDNQYETMEVEDICKLPIASIAGADSILFLWATSPKLPEALRVMAAWDFVYKTCMVWVKDKKGMGYYARQRHELLLIGTKGQPLVPAPENRPDSVVEAPRGKHSEKPDRFAELIELMYPEASKVELFARKARKNWANWGTGVD